jgi:hypothetical protein
VCSGLVGRLGHRSGGLVGASEIDCYLVAGLTHLPYDPGADVLRRSETMTALATLRPPVFARPIFGSQMSHGINNLNQALWNSANLRLSQQPGDRIVDRVDDVNVIAVRIESFCHQMPQLLPLLSDGHCRQPYVSISPGDVIQVPGNHQFGRGTDRTGEDYCTVGEVGEDTNALGQGLGLDLAGHIDVRTCSTREETWRGDAGGASA